jgi:hypothetical protein
LSEERLLSVMVGRVGVLSFLARLLEVALNH